MNKNGGNMKKNNKKDNKNRVGLIAIAFILVAALIAGGTYAYWIWNSNNIAVVGDNCIMCDQGIGLTLNGGTVTVNKLAPAACTHSTYSTKVTTPVSRYNSSPYPAYVTLRLSLTSLTFNHGTLTSADLGYVHYLLSTSSSNCNTAVTGSIPGSASAGTAISGTLSGATIGTSGTAKTQTTTLVDWVYKLPPNSGTSSAPVNETYYLYVWIDPAYSFTNYGSNSIQDPLQDLSFILQWSAASDIQQQVS